jgi:hypothetical protein
LNITLLPGPRPIGDKADAAQTRYARQNLASAKRTLSILLMALGFWLP